MIDELDCWHTDNVVCPHCGYEESDSWERGPDGGECDSEDECGECGGKFQWSRGIEVHYTTKKLDQGKTTP